MIENLIFDVGNVLLGFRTTEVLLAYGMTAQQEKDFSRQFFMDPLWEDFDTGITPFWDVVEQFCHKLPHLAKDIRWLMEHCELMKVDRPAVWEQVHRLKQKGYGIYLLSNYGQVFYEKHYQDAPFMADVDGAVLSYQVHEMKPAPGIYQRLLNQYSLRPETCLFFDDREENVRAGEALGIAGFLVRDEEALLEKLKSL